MSKIFRDEDGKTYVTMVPDAWFRWAKDRNAAEIGRTMQRICELVIAADEAALAEYEVLATHEHIQAWEEGMSVTRLKH